MLLLNPLLAVLVIVLLRIFFLYLTYTRRYSSYRDLSNVRLIV
jgi:hypothetical protein